MSNPEILPPKERALTARELIKVLQRFDPELPVYYRGEDEWLEVEEVHELESDEINPRRLRIY
jgi:hypothetical protein